MKKRIALHMIIAVTLLVTLTSCSRMGASDTAPEFKEKSEQEIPNPASTTEEESVTEVNSITIRGVAYDTNLTELNLNDIDDLSNADIEPLKYMSHLERLDMSTKMGGISDKRLSDITMLSGLKKLTYLDLNYNNISDISPLAGLSNLSELALAGNKIEDISALSELAQLEWLSLSWNQISDISALKGLTNLTELLLIGNPIDKSQLAELEAALPNCSIVTE